MHENHVEQRKSESVFEKVEINFGNLIWEKWTKSSEWWLTNSKLLKVTTNNPQKSD